MPIQTRNPATGNVLKTFEPHTDAEVDLAIARSVVAFETLRQWRFEQRAAAMLKLAELLRDEVEALGQIMTTEMGKTLTESIAEVNKCASVCDYYARHAQSMLADEPIETEASRAFRRFLPLGPVLAVMPWNYPIWQVMRFAAPALMAGNTGLLKHASNVPQCALYIEDIIARSGFPEGAFQTLLIGGDKAERILRDDRVRAATLTGSEPAGASVASICGEEIKPVVLELGGSDAFIIMPSADIDAAVSAAVLSRTKNNGQSCIAAKRFLVHAEIYDTVRDKLKSAFEALNIGDPMDEATDIGPLVNPDSVDTLNGQVEDALSHGAVRVCGAKPVESNGAFYEPGILENIPKTAKVYSDEIFGPVALLFKINGIDEAIALANDSPFGLSSAIYTQNKDEQDAAISGLEAGATFINSMSASDARLPFGGIKRSGIGRELSREGIRAFCNIKSISQA